MEKRVLVVDDDAATRQMVLAVLKRSSFVVDSCADGREAAECLRSADYGVVVLGLVRRDPDGDTGLLRSLGERDEPPSVILLSAGTQAALDDMESDLIKARLRKPFQIEQLVSAVQNCFASTLPR